MDARPYFGKEIVFQEDIERGLSALQLTVGAAQVYDGDTPEASAFYEGYITALLAMKRLFGIPSGSERSGGGNLEE
jgi:hypothetical protein